MNHLFLHCEVAVGVWGVFIRRCGVAWCSLKNIAKVTDSWRGVCFHGCGRVLWKIIPFAMKGKKIIGSLKAFHLQQQC